MNGIQRELFLPCIELIKEHSTVHNMSSEVDYRFGGVRNGAVYFHPLTEGTTRELGLLARRLIGAQYPGVPATIAVAQGRELRLALTGK